MRELRSRAFRCPRCGMAASEVEKELGTWTYVAPQRWTLRQLTCASGCRLEAGDLGAADRAETGSAT